MDNSHWSQFLVVSRIRTSQANPDFRGASNIETLQRAAEEGRVGRSGIGDWILGLGNWDLER
jgi:hypothetical protein